jgi:hypothetical protein
MRHVLLAATAATLVLVGARPARAGAGLPSSPFDYAVFALDRVVIHQGAQVDRGDVGVNSSSGEVQMRFGTRIAGNAAANTIAPGRNARVNGTMFCNTGPVGPPGCSPVTLPLADTSLLPIVDVEPGNDNVRVGAKLASTLTPGKYGKVRLGTKSRLRLEPGTYAFRSLTILRGASLLCDGACTIGVSDGIEVGQAATLSTVDPPDATKLRLEIERDARRHAALRSHFKSRIDATAYAPAGIIMLGKGGQFTGAFVAREVEVLHRARVLSEPQP